MTEINSVMNFCNRGIGAFFVRVQQQQQQQQPEKIEIDNACMMSAPPAEPFPPSRFAIQHDIDNFLTLMTKHTILYHKKNMLI